MTKQHTVAVSIGAALKGSFKTAFASGNQQLVRFGDGIKKLEARSKSLEGFNKLQADVQKAAGKLSEAENKVAQLRQEMLRTDQPSKQMQVNFGRAQAAANKARAALQGKRTELAKVRKELNITSLSSKNLVLEQTKLGTSADKLRGKYKLLNSSLQRQQQIASKRANLRGQVFDMVALGAAIGAPVKAAIDFENAMADVKKVIALPEEKDRADKVIADLEKGLKEMSRTIPISAKGLATIAASGAQLGVGSTKNELTGQIETNIIELQKFVELASKMAIAFDLSEEEAGQAMANLSNIFGIPIADMEELGDAINFLSDNTAAKAKDIVKALTRVGGVGKGFGLDPKVIAALADSFIALGKAPEEAGTAINRLLTRLLTADQQSPRFQSALAKMGLEASQLKEAIENDAEGALVSFLQQLSKVDKIERTGIIFGLFGQQQVGNISALAGQVDVFTKALDVLKTKDNTTKDFKFLKSMEREFKNRSATTANQLNLFTNSLAEVGITVGATVLPAINSVLGVVGDTVRGFADLSDRFPLLTKLIFGTVFGLVALKIAGLGIAFLWTFISGGAAIAATSLAKLGISISVTGIKFEAFNLIALKTAIRTKALAVTTFIFNSWKSFGLVAAAVKAQLLSFNLASSITFVRMKAIAVKQGIMTAWGAFSSAVSFANTQLVAFSGSALMATIRAKTLAFGAVLAGVWNKMSVAFALAKTQLLTFNAAAAITFLRAKALVIGQAVIAGWVAFSASTALADTGLLAFNATSIATVIQTKALAVGQSLAAAWAFFGNTVLFTNAKLVIFNAVSLITTVRMKLLAAVSTFASAWSAIGVVVTSVKGAFLAFNLATATSLLRIGALAAGQGLVSLFSLLSGAVSLAAAKLGVFNVISSITAIGLKALAFGGMIKAFAAGLLGLATSVIPMVIGGLKLLTVAFLTNPIGLVIGGIALAAGFLIAKWGTVKGFFADLWEPVQAVWQTFADWVGGFWKIISAPFTAISKLFGFLFGSDNTVKADIKSTQEEKATGGFDNNDLPQRANSLQESIAGGVIGNQRTVDSKEITNNFNITVNAAPGQDEDSIADKVMRQIKDMSRGALFDTSEATL